MTKECSKCHKEKEIAFFNKKKSRKSGLQPFCKECNSAYLKTHYQNNKKYYYDKANRYKYKFVSLVRELKNKPCTDCKIQYPYYVMDFDHKSNKKFSIANALHAKSQTEVMKEIEKCDVVCANCHRERTHKRLLRKDQVIERVFETRDEASSASSSANTVK